MEHVVCSVWHHRPEGNTCASWILLQDSIFDLFEMSFQFSVHSLDFSVHAKRNVYILIRICRQRPSKPIAKCWAWRQGCGQADERIEFVRTAEFYSRGNLGGRFWSRCEFLHRLWTVHSRLFRPRFCLSRAHNELSISKPSQRFKLGTERPQ